MSLFSKLWAACCYDANSNLAGTDEEGNHAGTRNVKSRDAAQKHVQNWKDTTGNKAQVINGVYEDCPNEPDD